VKVMDGQQLAKEFTPDLRSPQPQGGENTPVAVPIKRPRGSPTFHMPHKARKRIPLRQKTSDESSLAPHVLRLCTQPTEQSNSKPQENWSDLELQQNLYYFILIEIVGLLTSKRFSGTVSASMYILEEVTTLLERVSNKMHCIACIDFLYSFNSSGLSA